jgi:glutamate-ammonia-ligase adenylyltransferase
MELWERFALGQSRLVCGDRDAMALVLLAAYRLSIGREELEELLAMKKRIENERVKPTHARRNVKLGYGGLSDIDWMVHLGEMKFKCRPKDMRMATRIESLGAQGLLTDEEIHRTVSARRFLIKVRTALQLQGYQGNIVPENPDKLDILAKCLSKDRANGFLSEYENTIESVRSVYLEVINRLSL